MKTIDAKQVWNEVFDGCVQNAIEWTHHERNSCSDEQMPVGASFAPLVLYLEPSLNSNAGHQLTLANCYIELFGNNGYQTIVAHSLVSSLRTQKGWLPYFLVKHNTMESRCVQTIEELERVRQYFHHEFEKIINHYNPAVCVFATIRFVNVVAAAEAMVSDKIQHVIFGIMEAESVPDCADINIVRSAFSRAAKILQKHSITHLLVAETEHVKTFLIGCGFRKRDVRVFPYVAAKLVTESTAPTEKEPGKIHVGYLGGSRPPRHPELVAKMIVSEPIPDSVNLSVQFNLDYLKKKCGQSLCDQIVEMDIKGEIKLYPANLSIHEYRSLFCSLDLVILPYGERYEQIGSGIFFEAIYADVIPICAADSKIRDIYTSLGVEPPCFKSLSTTAIRGAIIDGVERIALLRNSTRTVRENWRKHPASVEQWRSELSNWLPPIHSD